MSREFGRPNGNGKDRETVDSMGVAMPERELETSLAEPFIRLGRDMRDASRDLTMSDARWLVDEYYTMQDARIRSAHQTRTHDEAGEPHRLIDWVSDTMTRFESSIKRALGAFAETYRAGQWMQAQTGIGPVLSAGLLINFDIRKAPTVGHFWRFAGLDPTLIWPGTAAAKAKVKELGIDGSLSAEQVAALSKWSGQHESKIWNIWNNGFHIKKGAPAKGKAGLVKLFSVRPWNHNLKCICLGRLGESFNKNRGRDKCFYGQLLAAKQQELWAANLSGEFADVANRDVAAGRFAKTTEAYSWKSGQRAPGDVRACIEAGESPVKTPKSENGEPMLPPQQVYYRARRWVVKLFLSHLHHVMHVDYFDKVPPAPFVFAHPTNGEHRHLVEPPLWPGDYDGRKLRELLDRE